MKAKPRPALSQRRRSSNLRMGANSRYHHGALRKELLRAARELLEDAGYEALTLRAAARLAGVSQAAPYHHFLDKAALLNAVAAEGFRDFASAMQARMVEASDPRERLTAAGLAYVDFAVGNPAVFKLMFSGVGKTNAEPELAAASSAAFRVLRDAVTGSDEPNESATPRDSGIVHSLSAWALVHGLATLLNEGGIEPSRFGFETAAQLTHAILGDRNGLGLRHS